MQSIKLKQSEFDELKGCGVLHMNHYSLFAIHWLTHFKRVCALFDINNHDRLEMVEIYIEEEKL